MGIPIAPDQPYGLTDEQHNLVQKLKTHKEVQKQLQAHAHLTAWCDDFTCIRFLRAREWRLERAATKLAETLHWRATYRPESITWDEVEPEAATGKQFRLSVPDKSGRAVIVMRPRCENTRGTERQLRFLVYHLESACRAADEAVAAGTGEGKMTWLIDFEGYSFSNAPSVRTSLTTLSILQNHYPERLGLAVCYHPPRLFQLTWKACKPLIDPVTHKKIIFIDPGHSGDDVMTSHFDMSQIEKCMGGQAEGGEVFELQRYAQTMRAEDARRLAAAVKVPS